MRTHVLHRYCCNASCRKTTLNAFSHWVTQRVIADPQSVFIRGRCMYAAPVPWPLEAPLPFSRAFFDGCQTTYHEGSHLARAHDLDKWYRSVPSRPTSTARRVKALRPIVDNNHRPPR